MPTTIRAAETAADFAAFGRLVTAYESWLLARYASADGLMRDVLAHQDLAAELASLPERYGPPAGLALLAEDGDDLVGGVGCRDLGDGTCEMKRMYVLDGFQGRGIGRLLCTELVARAVADGYRAMRLDTGTRNTEAIALYGRLGFRPCDPYRDYPPAIAAQLLFMERPLP